MGLGRQVADAYIAVHGDLSDFRKDLDKAGGYAAEQAAMRNADKFSDAWNKRIESDVNDRWGQIVDTMYSDKQLDWDRLVGTFDPAGNLDDAERKIKAFTGDMAALDKISAEDQERFNTALGSTLDLMRERNRLEEERAAAAEKMARAESDAATENERWARTFDGIAKNDAIKNLNKDFEKLATLTGENDIGKFVSGFDGFDAARARVVEVTNAMIEQGRMSRENQLSVIDDIHKHLAAQEELTRATENAAAATARAKAEQDRYNKSLDGMLNASHLKQTEQDFRRLTDAITSGDWSKISQGSKDMNAFRSSVQGTLTEMQRIGGISGPEFARLNATLDNVSRNSDAFGISFKNAGTEVEKAGLKLSSFTKVLATLGPLTQGVREHLGGFAGLNVFGDMIQGGLEFIHNLDRIALSISQVTLKLGVMGSAAGSSLGGLAVIGKDVADAVGQIGLLAPAFATGAALMLFTTATAMTAMKKKFKDTFKSIGADMAEAMSTSLDPAMDRFEKALLPTLKTQMKGLATAMGTLYGSIFDGIVESVSPEKMALMFGRLDDAIIKSQAGVKSLVSVWATLGEVGSKYYDRLATSFNNLTAKFDGFISKAAADGQLDQWIENGITGFKNMGRAIDGALGIFNAIDSAARAAGYGGLTLFADRLQGAAAIMQSKEFQRTMKTLFEGMASVVSQVGEAIGKLGPAVASIAPFIKASLEDIGTAAAIMIGYLGKVIADPAIHVAMLNFSADMVTALKKLEPAVGPFTASLAHALDLLGKILPNIADVAAAFTVNLSPVLDTMSVQLGTLITPLKDLTVHVIEKLTPAFKLLADKVVGPLIEGVRDHLVPAFSDAVDKLAPLVDTIVTTLAPVITDLATNILPGVVTLAAGLAPYVETIVKLAAPGIKTFFDALGDSIKNAAKDMVDFNKEADPFLQHIQQIADKANQVQFTAPKNPDTEKVNPWLTLATKWAVALETESVTFAAFTRFFKDRLDAYLRGWNTFVETITILSDPKKLTAAVARGLGGLTAIPQVAGLEKYFGGIANDVGTHWNNLVATVQTLMDPKKLTAIVANVFLQLADPGQQGGINDSVNKWFDDTIFKPIRDTWDGFLKGLDGWWKDVKRNFQQWMKDKFNLGAIFKDDTKITDGGGLGGGGAGAKGSGVGAVILPQLLDQGAEGSWLETFKTTLTVKLTETLSGLGGSIGTIGAGLKTGWDTLWTGIGTTLTEKWNEFTGTTGSKSAEMKTGIEGNTGGLKTGWDTLWAGVGTTLTEKWNEFTGTASTKSGEMKTGIEGNTGGIKSGWDTLWTGVGTVLSEKWNEYTGTTSTKSGEMKTGIEGNTGGIKSNWDTTWDQLKTYLSTAWGSMVQTVTEKVGEVVRWVNGIPGKINLGNTAGILVGAGSSIMGGLLSGLQGTNWSSVQSFVGGIAGWIAAHKGPISYDRTLLTPAGQVIMQGLGDGLRSQLGALKGTLDSITATVTDAITENFSKSRMYIAGADAALGLAQGLTDNKSTVIDAFASLTPDTGSGTVSVGAGAGTAAGGNTTIIKVEAGAIPITTPTQDPALVAAKVIDGFASISTI